VNKIFSLAYEFGFSCSVSIFVSLAVSGVQFGGVTRRQLQAFFVTGFTI
jgi:hypothetical protein